VINVWRDNFPLEKVKIEALKGKIFNFHENNENHKVYPSACDLDRRMLLNTVVKWRCLDLHRSWTISKIDFLKFYLCLYKIKIFLIPIKVPQGAKSLQWLYNSKIHNNKLYKETMTKTQYLFNWTFFNLNEEFVKRGICISDSVRSSKNVDLLIKWRSKNNHRLQCISMDALYFEQCIKLNIFPFSASILTFSTQNHLILKYFTNFDTTHIFH
jgi:hypothetical protein